MAFTPLAKLEKASSDSIRITDDSIWETLGLADFKSRTVVVKDFKDDTPSGLSASINFPFVNGKGDELTIKLPKDLALKITLRHVGTDDAIYSKTYITDFSGYAQVMFASRNSKSEIQKAISEPMLSNYREVTTTLANMIDGARYYAENGQLELSQTLLDKAIGIGIDTVKYDV